MRSLRLALSVLAALGAMPAAADTAKPYAGQQERPVSSFSEADVRALLAGEGQGLAKPAELNGYPGPAHLLEMQEELELDGDQIAAIQGSFDRMLERAKEIGVELLAAEAELDGLFRERRADPDTLAAALRKTADLRMSLRETHLKAHLEVAPLLTDHQRQAYALLRGYGGAGHGRHGSH